MTTDFAPRIVRAGFLTALVDGLFACVLALSYGGTIARLWQGVASTLLGPEALAGGTRTALIGLLMHVGVALTWSAVYVALLRSSAALRRLRASRLGVLKIAAFYGPLIWMVMSLAVIPSMLHRFPPITPRWWINFFGHILFVAVPIAVGAGLPTEPGPRSSERTAG